ncbi:MAG TPA: TetR family transcriptional regulator C-terminal domain-containing protein [Chryseosolibacter sp.]|nr:TetR family transcriptional regulator C-terminal domain-containing protein [Chryseosolibacter sp.]
MATTSARKSNKKSASIAPEDGIQLAYMDYLLNHGQRPPSVYKFTHDLGIREDEFYNHFGSFDGIERAIWKGFFERTAQRLKADNAYSSFTAREKILAFYYTFFEDLKSNRSFVLLQLNRQPRLEIVPEFLKDFKAAFETYLQTLLTAGKAAGEIAERPYIDKTYPQLFWMQLGFLLMFWRDDSSAAFEHTDAAIEKSVNLAFDLIGKGAVDTAFDFAKFLFQTKVK